MKIHQDNMYQYTSKDLLAHFAEYGLKYSLRWIYRQEQRGNLIVPKSTTNLKKARGVRKRGGVRLFTKRQIEGIIKAFLPGGTGYYDYRKEEKRIL